MLSHYTESDCDLTLEEYCLMNDTFWRYFRPLPLSRIADICPKMDSDALRDILESLLAKGAIVLDERLTRKQGEPVYRKKIAGGFPEKRPARSIFYGGPDMEYLDAEILEAMEKIIEDYKIKYKMIEARTVRYDHSYETVYRVDSTGRFYLPLHARVRLKPGDSIPVQNVNKKTLILDLRPDDPEPFAGRAVFDGDGFLRIPPNLWRQAEIEPGEGWVAVFHIGNLLSLTDYGL